jgi:hypothetical protein
MWIEKDILYGIYKEKPMDIEGAKSVVRMRKSLQNGAVNPAVIDIRNIKRVTKEARSFLASDEACEGITKCAIIIDSNLSMVFGNIYLKINKPPVPSKLFTSLLEARKWAESAAKEAV